MSATSWAGPLQGIRVLDFTRVLAGPAASLALADLGAEVIKIEPPSGDETRSFPPFREGESHYYLSVNRGKKSMVIDLKSEEGVQLAKDLAAKSDVLIENYRPGVMERLGLSYETLSELNPGLIYCSISGFGMNGPLRDRPSFDIVLQALSGALSVNGEPDSPLPSKLGIPMGDLVGGINGPIGILGALYERSQTGKGRQIDISLMDGMIGLLGYLAQLAFFTGEDPKPQGSQHPNLVPYGQFPAKDGSIIIACLTNAFWSRICTALGMPDCIEDPRFDSLEKRRDNREQVNDMVSAFTRQKTVKELETLLTEHQVPNAPILGIQEALSQPQAVAREMVVETEHKTLGKIPIVNRPIKFTGAQQATPTAPPVLGQDTEEILREVLGLSEEKIAKLQAAKTVS